MRNTVSRFAIIAITVIALISISACSPATSPTIVNTSSAVSSEEWSAVTVKDANGTDIVITEKPERIISLPVWSTEILFDMVETEKIVGISVYCDASALSATADQAALVEARVQSKNAEGIVALSPDLVILDTFNDFDGSLAKTLTEAGIIVLSMASPVTFDQIKASVTTLGKVTGEIEAGVAINTEIDRILNDVETKTASLSADDKLTVMYFEDYYDQSGANAGMLAAYGANSPFDSIAIASGLVNVCDLDTYSPVDRERVVGDWKPEVLVVPSIIYDENFNATDDAGVGIIAAIKNDTMLAGIPAVANNKIFAVSGKYMSSTSQYMAKAVEQLAKACYPELFD